MACDMFDCRYINKPADSNEHCGSTISVSQVVLVQYQAHGPQKTAIYSNNVTKTGLSFTQWNFQNFIFVYEGLREKDP